MPDHYCLGWYSKSACSNPFPANYNFASEVCDNLRSLCYVVVKLWYVINLLSKYFPGIYCVPGFVLGVRNKTLIRQISAFVGLAGAGVRYKYSIVW